MRRVLTTMMLLAIASPLAAQVKPQGSDNDPTHKAMAGKVPDGWTVRVDDKDAGRFTANDVHFVAMGPGMHVTSGPAAIYYNPKNAGSGDFTVHATFTQEKAPMHPEAYGVFIAGANLPDSTQSYLYFIVRGNGMYMIDHRAGKAVHKVVEWTASDAVHKQDAEGKATNTVAIKVGAQNVDFIVNGQTVKTLPKSGMLGTTSGQTGIRVNHNLDVHVADFGVSQ